MAKEQAALQIQILPMEFQPEGCLGRREDVSYGARQGSFLTQLDAV